MSGNNIEKLSACTNLDLVDKINELIDEVNLPDSIEVEAGILDRNLLKATSNFHCKLTIITKRKSVLIFAITNDGGTREVKPIFVESNLTEDQAEFKANSAKDFIYIDENNDIKIHYSQACIVVFDGLHGTYTKRDTTTANTEALAGTKPNEWLNIVPSTVVKTGNSNWLTVSFSYDNDGKANEFRIGFNDTAVLSAIQDLNEQIQRDLAGIIEDLRVLTAEDTRINNRINELSQALSALTLRVSTNETNISNISSTVNSLSTTVGSLSTTVGQHTTAIDALDGRLDNVESDISDIKGKNSEQDGRLNDIEDELANLDGSICKEVEISSAKEYTRIGRFHIPTVTRTINNTSVNTISDFNIELRVVTDQEDEIVFISTVNTEVTETIRNIKLVEFINKSYTNVSRDTVSNPNAGGELVIYEILPNDGYLDIYLKRYNSNRTAKVSVALINKNPNAIKYLGTSAISKDYNDFDFTTSNTQILDADDEFKHAMHPVIDITTDPSVTTVSDELVRDITTQLIYRRVTVPTSILEFDETQFEVSHVTTPVDKTIIKLKNSNSSEPTAYQCEARIVYSEEYELYVAEITKNGVSVSVTEMYDLIVNQGIQPSIKITTDHTGKIGVGAIFTLSNEYRLTDGYSLMFTNVNWNGIPSIIHGAAFDNIDVWVANTTSTIIDLGTYHINATSFVNRGKFELPGLTSSSTDEEYIVAVKNIYSQAKMILASGLNPQVRYHVLDDRPGYPTTGRNEIATGYYISTGCYNCFIFFTSANALDDGMWSGSYLLIGWYPGSATNEENVTHNYKWWTVSFNGNPGGAAEYID